MDFTFEVLQGLTKDTSNEIRNIHRFIDHIKDSVSFINDLLIRSLTLDEFIVRSFF